MILHLKNDGQAVSLTQHIICIAREAISGLRPEDCGSDSKLSH